jgi:hypothetical protein
MNDHVQYISYLDQYLITIYREKVQKTDNPYLAQTRSNDESLKPLWMRLLILNQNYRADPHTVFSKEIKKKRIYRLLLYILVKNQICE